MKYIKSFLLLAFFSCTAGFLKAQDVKAEVQKNNQITAPPATTITSIPSPAPVLLPMGDATPQAAPAKTNAAALPAQEPKPVLLSNAPNAAAGKLTPEQVQTQNGTAQRPVSTEPAKAVQKQ